MKQGGGSRLTVWIVAATVTLVLGQSTALQCPGTPGLGFAQQPAGANYVASPSAAHPADAELVAIVVDYPAQGSIFPPEITPPTFLWRDASNATVWRLDVTFADGSAPIQAQAAGEPLRIGEIDPRCISENNQLPKLTPEQAAARTWIPDAPTWSTIKLHSAEHPATITITGFSDGQMERAVSRGSVVIQTSKDPVGAPIFYRDVPLMPAELKKGVINPLAQGALPLLSWRIRNIAEPSSRLVLTGMHTCANCHSFSRDGKTMGMDLDGPANDKGLYSIASIKPVTTISNQNVIAWSSFRDETVATSRVGFMSQVSPDGRYVLTMLRGMDKELARTYYVVNFKNYNFLQVFYPTRGILAWYDRTTGQRHALPGADDPRYVQTDGVWSPDGKFIVFARAEAREPYEAGKKLPEHANDPEETQIQYDLYRIPFNDGKGGEAVPIAGASHDGMSNNFPKVSPDGRWIVFVKCRNAQLMRPDSQLYIVPVQGGVARRMGCNTPLMNSWHSFSPNGRWLVFSSKSRSPYTQMFLTHLDENGNDSPAILVDNTTAANRAVNLPEFVNIPPDGLMKIDVPAAESYRLFDIASDLTAKGHLEEGIAEWKKVLELDPANAKAHNNLGGALVLEGKINEGMAELRAAIEIDPDYSEPQSNYAIGLIQEKRLDEAMPYLERSIELNSSYAKVYEAIISNVDWPPSPPQPSLRLEDVDPRRAEEQTSQNASRQERESLDAEYRQRLQAVLAAIMAPDDSARGGASEDAGPLQPRSSSSLLRPLASPGLTPGYSAEPDLTTMIAHLEIPRLRKLAEQGDKSSDESFAAQRQILRIFLHTYEASHDLLAQNKVGPALSCLEIAAQAAPTNPYILYDLARAQALNGQQKKALNTLEAAVKNGFKSGDQAEGDRAFQGLRGKADFERVVAVMREKAVGSRQ
ncbi:MAG: tetratricopeptide repeat protein [Terriglobia bacterium]|jgi:tetratricopeptide (TPR) repeat protein